MSRWWASAVAGLLVGAVPSIAGAQTFELFGPDSSRSRHESTQNFLVELRGGPWYPDVDAEFNGRATPFADMFGTTDRLLLGAELDWQFLRINPIGSLGLGVGVGYTSASAIAPLNGYASVQAALGPTSRNTTSSCCAAEVTGMVRVRG